MIATVIGLLLNFITVAARAALVFPMKEIPNSVSVFFHITWDLIAASISTAIFLSFWIFPFKELYIGSFKGGKEAELHKTQKKTSLDNRLSLAAKEIEVPLE